MNIKKILIVDDSEPDQFLAKSIITIFDTEIEILQAYDGKEALDILDQVSEQPDVIFLDINMPVMDGHEFLENYSKREVQVAVVVMLTSSEQELDKQRSRSHKCVKDYFTKPLKVGDVESLKRRALEQLFC